MRPQIVFLLLAVFLSACGANSQEDELAERPDPAVIPEEPNKPDPVIPVPPEPPGSVIPPSVKPAPKVCINSHSGVEGAEIANNRADFVFYPGFSIDKLHSYEVLTSTSTPVEAAGSSSLTFPYQVITGNSLGTQVGFNNGEWQLETNSKNLIFKDTLTGEARQVSNFDFGGYQVCSITQIKPAVDRLSEFYISYGSHCALTSKVDLSMSATDAAIQIPNPAINEGTAIYDDDANWIGQLYKVVDQGVAKLVLQKPDFCSQNELFIFDSVDDAWIAKQFLDGSLLLQVGAKIYHLSSADLLAWVADEPSFTLPAESLITLANTEQAVWLDKNANNIFYASLVMVEDQDTSLKVITNAQLLVFDSGTGAQEAQLALYSAGDTDKTIVGFDKVILDDESVWLETRYTTKPAADTFHHRRYSRLNLTNNELDAIAQFDHQLKLASQKTEWHSIANKVYLKVDDISSINSALDPEKEKDYLLQAGAAAVDLDKVWYFVKQGSAITQKVDAVFAWDYSNHASSQYVPELINAAGSSGFPAVNRDIRISSMTTQFNDLSLFWDISCTTDCSDGLVEYRVTSFNHNNNSASLIRHESCDLSTDLPSPTTCSVNP